MSSPVRMEFAVKKKTRSNENQNELIDNQEVNDYGGVHITEESHEASQSMILNTSASYVYSSCNQSSNILYFPISPVQNSISIDSPSVLSMIPLSSLYPSFPSSVMSPPVCSIVSDVFGYHTEGKLYLSSPIHRTERSKSLYLSPTNRYSREFFISVVFIIWYSS